MSGLQQQLELEARPIAAPTQCEPIISLSAAASLVGLRGSPKSCARRLFRYLRSREDLLGGPPIMVRVGGDGSGRRYRVNVDRLRECCPEFFPRRDEIVDQVRAEISEFKDRMEEIADRQELVIDHVSDHATRLARLECAKAGGA